MRSKADNDSVSKNLVSKANGTLQMLQIGNVEEMRMYIHTLQNLGMSYVRQVMYVRTIFDSKYILVISMQNKNRSHVEGRFTANTFYHNSKNK